MWEFTLPENTDIWCINESIQAGRPHSSQVIFVPQTAFASNDDVDVAL